MNIITSYCITLHKPSHAQLAGTKQANETQINIINFGYLFTHKTLEWGVM